MRVAVILVIVGIVVGVLFYTNAENKRKMRMEARAFAEQVEYAEGQHAKIVEYLEGVDKFGPQVWEIMSTASNLIPEIVGAEDVPRAFDRNYDSRQRMAAYKAKTKPVAKAPDGKKTDVSVPTGVVVDEMGREAPAGYTPRGSEPVAVEPKKVKKTEPTDAGSVSSTPAGDQPTSERLAKCQDYMEKLLEHCSVVDGRINESVTIQEESTKILDQVRKSLTALKASQVQAGFKELVPMAKQLRGAIAEEIAAAEAIPPLLEKMRDAVREEKRLVEEAAERTRRAEEKEANRKREISRAASWYDGKADMLRTYGFKDAEDSVRELKQSLTFDEAISSLEIPVLRYKLMGDVMEWLKQSIKKTPMSWGWKTATGALDIESANDDGIIVQEKVIPWLDIPKDRLVGFLTHYLKASEEVGKSKAELYIGAALFCKTFGQDEKVDVFLDQARIESELAARNIDALMNFSPDSALTGN